MPWLGFIFLMGHMSINHIYRQSANAPEKVDVTGQQTHPSVKLHANDLCSGAQMVLIMKVTLILDGYPALRADSSSSQRSVGMFKMDAYQRRIS